VTGTADVGGSRTRLLTGLIADLLGEGDIAAVLDDVMAAAATLDIAASSISLVETGPTLRMVAASDDRAEHLVRSEVRLGAGPTLETAADGSRPGTGRRDLGRWPDLRTEAEPLGISSAAAFPLDAQGHRIGALVLYGDGQPDLGPDDASFARALADIVVLALLRSRTAHLHDSALDLTRALADQTDVERASGMVAELRSTSVRDGMQALRARALAQGVPVATLARAVIDRSDDPSAWGPQP
jgi:hypothetical protein